MDNLFWEILPYFGSAIMASDPSLKGYGTTRALYFDGNESKYEMWEERMLGYMKVKNLKEVILPGAIASTDRKEQCYAELIQFLDERSLCLVMREAKNDGRRSLEVLRQHYAGHSEPRIMSLYGQLSSLNMRAKEDVTAYTIRAETIATALKSSGEIVSDRLLNASVMKGLPSSYEAFTVNINASQKVVTFTEFKVQLRNFEENKRANIEHRQQHGGESESSDGIMHMKQLSMNDHHRNDDNNNRRYNNNNNDGGNCGQYSNRNRYNNKNRRGISRGSTNNNIWCRVCRNNSHSNADCRKQQQQSTRRRDDYRGQDDYHRRDSSNHVGDYFDTREQSPPPSEDNHSFIFSTSDEAEKKSASAENDMLVDCGATSHIVNDESKFVEFQEDFNPKSHNIELADGKVSNNLAEKRGTVKIHIQDENNVTREVFLQNTLYIPSFPQEIFSVKAACEKKEGDEIGAKVVLDGDGGTLVSKYGISFPISTKGKLYYLQLCDNRESKCDHQDNINKCTPAKTAVRTRSLQEWHKVLGHANKRDILQLESIIPDMKITSKAENTLCEPCVQGKQVVTRCKEPDERSTAPLEFIHSDLAGPIQPAAKDGFRYVMNFVDDYSGSTFVYFLRNKSDATRALEKFLADISPFGKVQYIHIRCAPNEGKIVKRLRSDNGGEFISKEFEDVLVKHQIRHEYSAPYSPHQNGTAERNWRTLFEAARCMLIESNLPKYLWTYAVMTAAHIRNRMYSQRIQDTPYHLLTGKQPSLNKLHVFGSVCFANVHQKQKLDPRCKKGIFVGYDKYSPAYLIYFPESHSIMKNATVMFTDQSTAPLPSMKTENTGLEFEPNLSIDVSSTEAQAPVIDRNVEPNICEDLPVENDEIRAQDDNSNTTPPMVESVLPDAKTYPRRTHLPPKRLGWNKDQPDTVSSDSICTVSEKPLPNTFLQATRSEESEEWNKAMQNEMSSLLENDVYTTVPLPPNRKLVGSRWVFTRKSDANENILFKARFVAKGYAQVEGTDYTDTFSPTAKITTIRMLLQFAIQYGMSIHQLDVKTAYLNAPIQCEVYIKPPEGFATNDTNGNMLVWRLKKSLYGLKQSGRNWNFVLTDFFESMGFKQSNVDACLFIKSTVNMLIFVVIWVDDIVLAANTPSELKKIKDALKNRFKMKDLGEISWFLGIEFRVTEEGIYMNQSRYIKNILKKYGMEDCNSRATPCESRLDKYDQETNNTPEEVRTYRGIVGSLIYAMTCSRPDLSFVVTKLSQRLERPTEGDWITVKHVLKYLKGSADQNLVYRKSEKHLKLSGYSDSDWATSTDRRSTTGYCFSLNQMSAPISWKSKKQETVALSSCEAEYMALTAATQEAMFLSMLTKDFGQNTTEPVLIRGDNQGSIHLTKNPVLNRRSKHIDIKHHFIREKYKNGVIDVRHVPTGENLADVFTKPMVKGKLEEFKNLLFGTQ